MAMGKVFNKKFLNLFYFLCELTFKSILKILKTNFSDNYINEVVSGYSAG